MLPQRTPYVAWAAQQTLVSLSVPRRSTVQFAARNNIAHLFAPAAMLLGDNIERSLVQRNSIAVAFVAPHTAVAPQDGT